MTMVARRWSGTSAPKKKTPPVPEDGGELEREYGMTSAHEHNPRLDAPENSRRIGTSCGLSTGGPVSGHDSFPVGAQGFEFRPSLRPEPANGLSAVGASCARELAAATLMANYAPHVSAGHLRGTEAGKSRLLLARRELQSLESRQDPSSSWPRPRV